MLRRATIWTFLATIAGGIGCNSKAPVAGNCVTSVDVRSPAWHDAEAYLASGGYLFTRGYRDSGQALSQASAPDLNLYYTARFEFRRESEERRFVRVYSDNQAFFSGLTQDWFAKVYWDGAYFDVPLRDPAAARRDAFRQDAGPLSKAAASHILATNFDPYASTQFWTEQGLGVMPMEKLGGEWCHPMEGKSSLRPAPGNRCIPYQAMGVREFEIAAPIPLGIAQKLDALEVASLARRAGSRVDGNLRGLLSGWDASHDEVNRLGLDFGTAQLAMVLKWCTDKTISVPIPDGIRQAAAQACMDVDQTAEVAGRHLNANGSSLSTITQSVYQMRLEAFRGALLRQSALFERIMQSLSNDPTLWRIELNALAPDILQGNRPAFLSLPPHENKAALAGFFVELNGRIPWLSIDVEKFPVAKVQPFNGTMLGVEGGFPFVAFATTEQTDETNGFADYMAPVANNSEDNRRAAVASSRPVKQPGSKVPATGVGPVPSAPTSENAAVDAVPPKPSGCL